jgi:hypothetical protein
MREGAGICAEGVEKLVKEGVTKRDITRIWFAPNLGF